MGARIPLGEAAKRLSLEFREQHGKIPWQKVAGMRDKLVHEYEDVDLDEVWKTARSDIPRLMDSLEPLAPRPDKT